MIGSSADQIAAAGYETVPAVFTDSETQALVQHFSGAALRRSRAGIRHLMNDFVVRDVAHDVRLLDLAKGALGERPIPFRATLFDKSSGSNWLVVWHQDTALPLQAKHEEPQWGPWSVKEGVIYAHAPAWALEQVIALRLHLDDSNEENGPLRVLPRSHSLGVLSDDDVAAMAQGSGSVECTVKTNSPKPRRVLHIEYAAESLMQAVPLAVA